MIISICGTLISTEGICKVTEVIYQENHPYRNDGFYFEIYGYNNNLLQTVNKEVNKDNLDIKELKAIKEELNSIRKRILIYWSNKQENIPEIDFK